MKRRSHVHAEYLAACPFSIAQEYVTDYLHHAEAGGDEAQVHVGSRGLGGMMHRKVAFSFGLRADATEQGRLHEEIVLHWSSRSTLLPNFWGVVRLRIAGLQTLVILEGEYVPPGGPLGSLFDTFVGRWIARSTARDIVARIAGYLGEREREWRCGRNGAVTQPSVERPVKGP